MSSTSPERFVNRAELKSRGVVWTNVHLLRLEREGRFPRRAYLGPTTVVWLASEIDAWMASKIAERDTGDTSDETV